MKSKLVILALIVMLLGSASTFAGRNPGNWLTQRRLSTEKDFSELQAGDSIAKICKNCDAVSALEIESEEQAMDYCREGEKKDCPSCENVATAKRRVSHGRTPNPPRGRPQIVYEDKHGEACKVLLRLD